MRPRGIDHLLGFDFSKGTEKYAEDLLKRISDETDADAGAPLTDEQMDLLAAAGEMRLSRPHKRIDD